MRWKRHHSWIWMLAALIAVGVGGLMVMRFQEREPEYQGRKLSQLGTAKYEYRPGPNGPVVTAIWENYGEYKEAITHLGTNAMPWLLKWIQYERSPMRDWCCRLANPILYRVKPGWQLHRFARENRAAIAVQGLGFLEHKAEAAVPRLAELMNDPRAPKTAERARMVITSLSFHLVAADLVLVTNTDARVRLEAIQRLERLDLQGRSLKPAIPTLVRCLRDKETDVAKAAATLLGQLATEAELVVPPLIESLERPVVRVAAIRALGDFRGRAGAAIPALRQLSTDPVPLVRKLATNALEEIEPPPVDMAGKK